MQESSVREVTDTQRKLYKQKVTETDIAAQKHQTNRQSKRNYNKPRYTVFSTSRPDKGNQKNAKENLEEEIKGLENEVASLKKYLITPPHNTSTFSP